MMSTETLSDITRVETEAQTAAATAIAVAEQARVKADLARQRADAQRAVAYQAYLDKLVAEHPAARSTALSAAGESRAALEQAVRTDDGVFAAYIQWVADSIRVWELDSELAQIRDHHGVPVLSTDPPIFRFDVDISVIIDGIAAGFQDDALRRIVDRRREFVNGGTSK